MSTETERAVGVVTLKKHVSGNSWEVSVQSRGPTLEEMQQASEVAKAIWNEVDAWFNPPKLEEEEVEEAY